LRLAVLNDLLYRCIEFRSVELAGNQLEVLILAKQSETLHIEGLVAFHHFVDYFAYPSRDFLRLPGQVLVGLGVDQGQD